MSDNQRRADDLLADDIAVGYDGSGWAESRDAITRALDAAEARGRADAPAPAVPVWPTSPIEPDPDEVRASAPAVPDNAGLREEAARFLRSLAYGGVTSAAINSLAALLAERDDLAAKVAAVEREIEDLAESKDSGDRMIARHLRWTLAHPT